MLRAMPHPGRAVLIEYLGSSVPGTVSHVDPDARRVTVVTEDGATLSFALNRATATFTADGGQTGPRLRFVPDPGH